MITAVRKFSVMRVNDNKLYIVLCIRVKDGEVYYFCATEDAGSPEAKNPEWVPDSEVAKVIVDEP